MKQLVIIALMTIVFTACSNPIKEQKEQFKILQDKAMESHDAIMPKMGELMQLSGQLSKRLDSTNRDDIFRKKLALNKAHDDMMEWMRDYSEKFPYGYELPEDLEMGKKQLDILQDEFEEIDELKVRTLQVIEDTKAYLK